MPAALDLEQHVATDIECETGLDSEQRRGKFLRKWKSIKGRKATYECLIKAFLEREERRNAESVCEILRDTGI